MRRGVGHSPTGRDAAGVRPRGFVGFLKEEWAPHSWAGERMSFGLLGGGPTRQALGWPPWLPVSVRRTKLEYRVREHPCFPLSAVLPSTSLKGAAVPKSVEAPLGVQEEGARLRSRAALE